MNRLILSFSVFISSLISNASVPPRNMSLTVRTSADTVAQVAYRPALVRGPSLIIRVAQLDEYGKQISERSESIVGDTAVCGTLVNAKTDCTFTDVEVGSGSALSYYFQFSCLNNSVNGFAEFRKDKFAYVVCNRQIKIMIERR